MGQRRKAYKKRRTQRRYQRACSPNTGVNRLKKLATDEFEEIRRRVAEHPNVTPEIIQILLNDENPFVRKAALRRI